MLKKIVLLMTTALLTLPGLAEDKKGLAPLAQGYLMLMGGGAGAVLPTLHPGHPVASSQDLENIWRRGVPKKGLLTVLVEPSSIDNVNAIVREETSGKGLTNNEIAKIKENYIGTSEAPDRAYTPKAVSYNSQEELRAALQGFKKFGALQTVTIAPQSSFGNFARAGVGGAAGAVVAWGLIKFFAPSEAPQESHPGEIEFVSTEEAEGGIEFVSTDAGSDSNF